MKIVLPPKLLLHTCVPFCPLTEATNLSNLGGYCPEVSILINITERFLRKKVFNKPSGV